MSKTSVIRGRLDLVIAAPLTPWVGLFMLSAVIGSRFGYDPSKAIAPLAYLGIGGVIYSLTLWLSQEEAGRRNLSAVGTAAAAVLALLFISQAGRMTGSEKVELIQRISYAISSFVPEMPVRLPVMNSVAAFFEGLVFVGAGLFAAEKRPSRRWAWGAATLCMAGLLILSSSRGAWMGVLAGGLVWLAVRDKRMSQVLISFAVLALVGAAWIIFQGQLEAVNRIPVFSAVLGPLFFRPDRLEVIRNSFYLAQDFTFTGIGLGDQFGLTYARYELFIPNVFLTYPHQMALGIWLQQGLIGLAAWAGLAACVAVYAVRGLPIPRGNQTYLYEATWAGLLAIFVHGLSDSRMVEDGWCWWPVFFLLGLNASYHSGMKGGARRIPALLAGVVLIGVPFLGGNPSAAWYTNLGSVEQQRADFSPEQSSQNRIERLEMSRRYFLRTLEFQPAQRGANMRLGMIALGAFDVEEAELYFQRAFQANPNHPATRKGYGLTLGLSGDFQSARRVLGDDPKVCDELSAWANYLFEEKRYDLSRDLYLLMLDYVPDAQLAQDRIQLIDSMR